jgi:hypothetical protein
LVRTADLCRRHLANVTTSHLTSDEARDLTARDERFQVERIL